MGGVSDEVDVASPENQQKFNERAQRFGKQGTDGNKNYKKKISIDELLKKTVVKVFLLIVLLSDSLSPQEVEMMAWYIGRTLV